MLLLPYLCTHFGKKLFVYVHLSDCICLSMLQDRVVLPATQASRVQSEQLVSQEQQVVKVIAVEWVSQVLMACQASEVSPDLLEVSDLQDSSE